MQVEKLSDMKYAISGNLTAKIFGSKKWTKKF